MKGELELSVVLPSYLEEENLRVLLPRLNKVLQRVGEPFEIVVVDTARPLDHTREVCLEQGARYVPREGGRSYGDAVRTGLSASKGRRVLLMDADGSHAPEFIPTLLAERGRADVVIASRYVAGGRSENSVPLRMMSIVLNLSYALILGLRCKDVSNSFKLYDGGMIRALRLRCDNFDVVEEILFKLARTNPGLRIVEVPFTFKKRMFGETKRDLIAFIFTYLYTIVKLRLMS
ncbi:MAG: glycosyltransferase [Elusimicrobiota bacterium]